jgi:hypothetical protein
LNPPNTNIPIVPPTQTLPPTNTTPDYVPPVPEPSDGGSGFMPLDPNAYVAPQNIATQTAGTTTSQGLGGVGTDTTTATTTVANAANAAGTAWAGTQGENPTVVAGPGGYTNTAGNNQGAQDAADKAAADAAENARLHPTPTPPVDNTPSWSDILKMLPGYVPPKTAEQIAAEKAAADALAAKQAAIEAENARLFAADKARQDAERQAMIDRDNKRIADQAAADKAEADRLAALNGGVMPTTAGNGAPINAPREATGLSQADIDYAMNWQAEQKRKADQAAADEAARLKAQQDEDIRKAAETDKANQDIIAGIRAQWAREAAIKQAAADKAAAEQAAADAAAKAIADKAAADKAAADAAAEAQRQADIAAGIEYRRLEAARIEAERLAAIEAERKRQQDIQDSIARDAKIRADIAAGNPNPTQEPGYTSSGMYGQNIPGVPNGGSLGAYGGMYGPTNTATTNGQAAYAAAMGGNVGYVAPTNSTSTYGSPYGASGSGGGAPSGASSYPYARPY